MRFNKYVEKLLKMTQNSNFPCNKFHDWRSKILLESNKYKFFTFFFKCPILKVLVVLIYEFHTFANFSHGFFFNSKFVF